MGYIICTTGVQIFLGYKRSKWGTVGSPGTPTVTHSQPQPQPLPHSYI